MCRLWHVRRLKDKRVVLLYHKIFIRLKTNNTDFLLLTFEVKNIQKPLQVSQNGFEDGIFVQPGDMFITKFVANEKKDKCKFDTSPNFVLLQGTPGLCRYTFLFLALQ